MIEFFYGLPFWLATLLVLAISLALGLASSFGLRSLLHLKWSEGDGERAISLMQVVAAYIGILIAFAGVQVWQDYSDAENAVHREAASAAQLYRNLSTYGPETLAARQALRAYVESVIKDEWPLLPEGQANPRTEIKLFKLFDTIGQIQPGNARDTTIYQEAFKDLNDLVVIRRDRLIHGQAAMPMILWVVGLFGSVLLLAYTATFPPTLPNVVMVSGLSMALGLVFLFILTVDRPFSGKFSVKADELAQLSAKFDLLDRLSQMEEAGSTP